MIFGAAPPALQRDLIRERTARLTSTPIAKFAYVDATWTGAGTIDITHTLAPAVPDNVRWLVVSVDAAITIYRDTTGSAPTWTATTVWLTASGAGTARLLLFLETQPQG